MADGFHEAGVPWVERWCEDHDEPEASCTSCLGESHDAWMHRAKAAEAALREIADRTYAAQYENVPGVVVRYASRIHDIARRALDVG